MGKGVGFCNQVTRHSRPSQLSLFEIRMKEFMDDDVIGFSFVCLGP